MYFFYAFAYAKCFLYYDTFNMIDFFKINKRILIKMKEIHDFSYFFIYIIKKKTRKNIGLNIAMALTPDNIKSIYHIDDFFLFRENFDFLMLSVLYCEGNASSNYQLDMNYCIDFHKSLIDIFKMF